MKKRLIVGIVCIIILFMGGGVLADRQEALAKNSRYVTLGKVWTGNQSKTFNKYDVTGDGRADKIKISVSVSDKNTGKLKIYVDNKMAYENTVSEIIHWNVGLVYLEAGTVFFDIRCLAWSDDVELHKLYYYKNGNFKVGYDFLKYYRKYAGNVDANVDRIKGNTIYAGVSGQFWTTGGIGHTIKIQYKDGKLRNVSTYCPISYGSDKKNKWTSTGKLKVYKKPDSDEVAYTLKKGDVIRIDQLVYRGKKIYFQVKRKAGKGGIGYIREVNAPAGRIYFKEAFFSG